MKRIEAIIKPFKLEEVDTDAAVVALVNGARTGTIGDGKIFVGTIEHAVRTRTDETGLQAI
jgi:nitrogen regulatory protein PII